ncbi:hypothetical protein BGZ83_002007 [Gryganskiella cystojenkinii]|nr:hypothetical protein BGZ83_002007 [Gryganskiella cystojenkinii]
MIINDPEFGPQEVELPNPVDLLDQPPGSWGPLSDNDKAAKAVEYLGIPDYPPDVFLSVMKDDFAFPRTGCIKALGRAFGIMFAITESFVDHPEFSEGDLDNVKKNRLSPKFVNEDDGVDLAILTYKALQMNRGLARQWDHLAENYELTINVHRARSQPPRQQPSERTLGLNRLQIRLGYVFTNWENLYLARFHGQPMDRMEQGGDSLLYYFGADVIHEAYPRTLSSVIVQATSECVTNNALSFLGFELGLHLEIPRSGVHLFHRNQAISEFTRRKHNRDFSLQGIWENTVLGRRQCKLAADPVEALVFAVFLDSGFNRNVARDFVTRIMLPFWKTHILDNRGVSQLPISASSPFLDKRIRSSTSLVTSARHVEQGLLLTLQLFLGRGPLPNLIGHGLLEVPSIMLENWLWEPTVLKRVGKHYKTGDELPDDLIGSLVRTRKVIKGLLFCQQIAMTAIVMRLRNIDPQQRTQPLPSFGARRVNAPLV